MRQNQERLLQGVAYFNPRTPCGVRPRRFSAAARPCSDFNPRTPCGVRPSAEKETTFQYPFQSTHPLRGATLYASEIALIKRISIHAPLAGCDRSTQCDRLLVGISIHAPLAGCDLVYLSEFGFFVFQSTHPLRGATRRRLPGNCWIIISIHAPLAGCDRTATFWGRESAIFQSTHPLRGATTAWPRLAWISYFNPRTPCGVRPDGR